MTLQSVVKKFEILGRIVLSAIVLYVAYWTLTSEDSPFSPAAPEPIDILASDGTPRHDQSQDQRELIDSDFSLASAGQWGFADAEWQMGSYQVDSLEEAERHLLDASALPKSATAVNQQLQSLVDVLSSLGAETERFDDHVRQLVEYQGFRVALFKDLDGNVIAVRVMRPNGNQYSLVTVSLPAEQTENGGSNWTLPLPPGATVVASRSDTQGRESAKFVTTSQLADDVIAFWSGAGWKVVSDPLTPRQWYASRDESSFSIAQMPDDSVQSTFMLLRTSD